MFRFKLIAILAFLTFLSMPTFVLADLVDAPGLTCNDGPTGACDGQDYIWYETLENGVVSGYWSPSRPGNVEVGYSATVTGYGYIEASLSYTVGSVSGSLNLRDEVGAYFVIAFVPVAIPAINQTVGSTEPIGSIGSHFGRYDWNLEGTAAFQAVYWKPVAGFPIQGGSFEDYGGANNRDVTGSGSFNVSAKKYCPECGSTDISYFAEHKYMSCPVSITQNGTTVYCGAGTDVWKCQDHTHVFPSSGSGSNPVDNTPNCQDCTSDCSVPCNCTSSGTCGGTPTDNTPNCSYCTDGCSWCDDDDASSEVTCGAASWTGCTTSVSSETEHKVWSCSHCGKSYWTCGSSVLRHTETFTCVRSGCGVTFTRCTNNAGDCLNPNYVWHKKP